MTGLRRGFLAVLLLTATLGTVIGSACGFAIGRALLWRAAKAGLAEYSNNLVFHADQLSRELGRTFDDLNRSPDPFCSADELARLRARTFASPDLKDIGRTRSGVLYCSALLGHLPQPYVEGTPSLTLADGTNVWANIPVVVAASSNGRATVVESGNFDVVLSPEAFDHWNRSRVGYRIALYNPRNSHFIPIAGASWHSDPGWSIVDGFRTSEGFLYRSQCSHNYPICASVMQAIPDIWAASRATQIVDSAMGGAAGFGMGFGIGLLYLRSESLRQQLRRALRRNSSSLQLVYEPIIDLASRQCVGAEALMRWKDEDGAAVSPEIFIRLAEDSGFIDQVTEWVLRRAMQDLAEVLRAHPDFSLSINVAASDMNGPSLFRLLEENVRASGVKPDQIVLELTERSTSDTGRIRASIERLVGHGYKVHIDDFGTGFSSLSYLDRLAVHAIKVDRSFTRTIGTEAVTVTILPQMLEMAETLNIHVVVEGIETESQLQYLDNTLKPIRVQGWYFSPPMTAAALSGFLANNRTAQRIQPPQPSSSLDAEQVAGIA
jgi:sensor c-di-GMP phosphodiesterase-like protein